MKSELGVELGVYDSFLNMMSWICLDFIQFVPMSCMVNTRWSHFDSLLLETLTPLMVLGLMELGAVVQSRRRPERKKIHVFR